MGFILILMLMGGGQSSMITHEFSDLKSCQAAGETLLEVVNKETPVSKRLLSFECIKVNGLR